MAEVSPFRRDLAIVINHYSRESGSDTPDFVLAQYLDSCVAAFDDAVRQRDAHRSRVARENASPPSGDSLAARVRGRHRVAP